MNTTQIEKTFDEYTSNYNLNDPKVELKYIHTRKVAENCRQIAKSLSLSPEDEFLSWEIGMLHDIGRFEQLRRFNTFNDSESIDHASFGADLLFKENLISQFDSDFCHYGLVETAIRCHSLYELPDGLSQRERLFCDLIRDADKVDIYRANFTTKMEDIYNCSSDELANALVTPQVFQAFEEHHTVLRALKKSVIDNLIGHLSLYFGLVYPESKKMAVEQGYLWKLANFHSNNPESEKIFEQIRDEYRDEWSLHD